MATSPTLALDGKIILITGGLGALGLGALGLAIVHRLSRRNKAAVNPPSEPPMMITLGILAILIQLYPV